MLFGVSLDLRAGEVVALVGRNGAGKSTTLKAILGLVAASAERLVFRNRSLLGFSTYRIARLGLGYVPEDRRIFTDLTVDENLEVGRQAQRGGQAPWTPERLFGLFPNLAELRRRRGNQMSGGEQQMLSIARTLMGNPEAILLDEPSEGLAPVIVQMMAEAIRAMKAEGVAVLLSSRTGPSRRPSATGPASSKGARSGSTARSRPSWPTKPSGRTRSGFDLGGIPKASAALTDRA